MRECRRERVQRTLQKCIKRNEDAMQRQNVVLSMVAYKDGTGSDSDGLTPITIIRCYMH